MIHKTPFVSLQVLERKDLSKAGDLFSLEDSVIVDELSAVIKALQVPCFVKNYSSKRRINRRCKMIISLSGDLKQARVSDLSQRPILGRDLGHKGHLCCERD